MAGFDNSYAALGADYAAPQPPTPVAEPAWLAFNTALADALDWPAEWRNTDTALQSLGGNGLLSGSEPVATAYAGHQFGSYNPKLGDGRAVLLGEWVSNAGARFDVQLKGAGRTPFSRGGDGRSPVGPVVREYLLSEAMHALGVPTTRALAAVSTGERVFRETVEPGAILTRVASSHLRIGTVQYFAMTRQGDGLDALIDYVTERHYGAELERARSTDPAVSTAQVLLSSYTPALAALVARWQVLGFVHGVLNTDNMLLCGETVDYGPCAFMDRFDPEARFSSIDTGGRYAWPNQPQIAHWNLSVLAQCLLPLLAADQEQALAIAQAEVDAFPNYYFQAHGALLAARFGLDVWRDDDRKLVDAFYQILSDDGLDHTLAFRWLAEFANDSVDQTPLPELFTPSPRLQAWTDHWHNRRRESTIDPEHLNATMRQHNPSVIPRNHQVARAIAAAEQGDTTVLEQLSSRWSKPWEWHPEDLELARPPEPEEIVQRTFCGT
ncbi:MAG: YdiU family protein [Halieaceae bacterium]|jgi:uncharacterized protein YdiU (UPF0061 family)|nr:YdiU family protein [Halieaceae bacterium]